MPGTNTPMTNARQELRQFIVQNFLFGQDQDLADGKSLLESGIIDSTGVLEVVAHLEKAYSVKVKNDELIPDNLDSIDAIVAYLDRKRSASGWPG
jgi:acyl carrier protein